MTADQAATERARNSTQAGEAVDALLALASALEDARRACNICGEPWPTHAPACAYPANVRELEARLAEVTRERDECARRLMRRV